MLAETSKARKGIDDVNKRLGGITKFAKGAGLALVGAFATGAAVNGIKSIVSAASDAQQSLGATETVFGKFSDAVVNDSNRAAKQFGLSANTYRENANLIGSLFKNQGVATGQLAGKTKDMIGTASDLAATFGGTTTSAVEALSSAFKGEFDPLERYGISIKQSTINAELAAKGQDKLTGAALKQAQQQATTNLIMKQSKDSAGAFVKETNTLAHQQQVLGAQFDNVKAALGTRLLPIATKTFAYLSNNVPMAVAKVKQAFSDAQPQIDAVKGAFSAVLPSVEQVKGAFTTVFGFMSNNKAVVGTFVGVLLTVVTAVKAWTIAQAALNLVMSVNPISLLVLAVAGLAAGLVYAYNKSSTFRSIVQGAFAVVKTAANALKPVFSVVFKALGLYVKVAYTVIKTQIQLAVGAFKMLVSGAQAIIGGVRSAFGAVTSFIKGIPGKIKGFFSGAGTMLSSVGTDIVQGLGNGITNSANRIISWAMKQLTDLIPGKIKSFLGIRSPSRVTMKLGKYVSMGLAKGMLNGRGDVTKSVKSLADVINEDLPKKIKGRKAIRKWYREHEKDVKSGTKAVLKALANDAKSRLNALKAQRNSYAAAVKDAAKAYAGLANLQLGENENLTGGGIKQFLIDRLAAIRNFNAKLAALRKKGISNDLYNQIVQMGVEQGTSYAEALSQSTPAAIKELNNLQGQINSASGALGSSTANAMYKSGVDSAQGYYNGLNSMLKKIASMGTKMSKSLVKSLKKALGIRSPSRVMKGLGLNTVEGLNIGLDDKMIKAKGIELSKALQTGFKSPQLDAQLAAGYAASNTKDKGDTYIFNITLDPTKSEEQQGVELSKKIQKAKKAGLIRV